MAFSNEQVLDYYIERGLRIIRVSNHMSGEAVSELTLLSNQISRLLSAMGRSTSSRYGTIRDARALVIRRFAAIAAKMQANAQQLAGIESVFAARVLELAEFPNDPEKLARAVSSMLFTGAKFDDHWEVMAQRIGFRVASAIRNADHNNQSNEQLRASILGPQGVISAAKPAAAGLVSNQVHAAAHVGREIAWKKAGIKLYKWHAILDSKVCPNCGLRAGRLYDDEMKPVEHDLEMVSPPPLHYWCRCMLVPQRPGSAPKNEPTRFQDWFGSRPQSVQEDILGEGRARLWRDGVITLSDLIGQNGLVMTLKELSNLK